MENPLLDHEGSWTEDAYLALIRDPALVDGHRVELIDGVLVVGTGPCPNRRRAVAMVRDAMSAALPDGLHVLGPVALRLGPDCVLVPDLVVTRVEPEEAPAEGPAPVLDCSDALLVVEVVGGEHGVTDRSFKPQLYARSRIPYSLLIDHDGPFALANMIIGGRYHEYAYAAAGERLVLEEPFGLDLDLDTVTGGGPPDPAVDHGQMVAHGDQQATIRP